MPGKRKPAASRLEKKTLGQLCGLVVDLKEPYEDLEELVGEKAFELCNQDHVDEAVGHIGRIAAALEELENKNEENLRDLGSVYALIGELLQAAGRHVDSIPWLQKAVVAGERTTRPYQVLARSYAALGEVDMAIRSLEQEIRLSPGNYFSYLMLADLYEKRGQDHEMEQCVERLLMRDSENIQALHVLIRHHEKRHPGLDVELLRRRLLSTSRTLHGRDLMIWVYHMWREGRLTESERLLEGRIDGRTPDPAVVLLLAHVRGLRGQTRSRRELMDLFKGSFRGRTRAMKLRLDEFAAIFGHQALSRRLPATAS